jgi:large subunit ribosomal protein L21
MFAIIRTGGKQYKVQKDDKIFVEKLDGKEGASVSLNDVLYVADGKTAKMGDPVVKGAEVTAKILRQDRAAKITIFKKKRRKGYRRTRGHRQHQTVLQITDIKAAA